MTARLVALRAESSLLGSDDVLTALVQLAGHMLTACTAAHRSLLAVVTSAASGGAATASAEAASTVDAAPCDVIDLTADDYEEEMSSQHAAAAQAATDRQGFSHPHLVQCKAEPLLAAALPEQDMPCQQGGQSPADPPLQAALPEHGMPQDKGGVPEQAEALPQQAMLSSSGLPDQALRPESARGDHPSQAAAAGTDRQLDEEQQVDEGVLGEWCMLCAYGMDLAAAVSCLLNQVDSWLGTA